MIREAAFICDVYEAVKTYVSKSELDMVAEDLVRIFDEYGFTEGFDEPTLNNKLKKAIKALYGDDEDEKSDDVGELDFTDYGDYDDD